MIWQNKIGSKKMPVFINGNYIAIVIKILVNENIAGIYPLHIIKKGDPLGSGPGSIIRREFYTHSIQFQHNDRI